MSYGSASPLCSVTKLEKELIVSLAQLFIVNWWKNVLHYIDITYHL